MDFFKSFLTRWQKIAPGQGYRLACSHPICSLSCANLKKGRLSVTSIHGTERHSYEFTTGDMVFTTISFLNSLTESELSNFVKVFNKMSPTMVLTYEKIGEE